MCYCENVLQDEKEFQQMYELHKFQLQMQSDYFWDQINLCLKRTYSSLRLSVNCYHQSTEDNCMTRSSAKSTRLYEDSMREDDASRVSKH